jgi:hypothetical protein
MRIREPFAALAYRSKVRVTPYILQFTYRTTHTDIYYTAIDDF